MLVMVGFEEESTIQQETRERRAHWQNQDKKRKQTTQCVECNNTSKGKKDLGVQKHPLSLQQMINNNPHQRAQLVRSVILIVVSFYH